MSEEALAKVLRLATAQVKSYQRVNQGRVQNVRQYQQSRAPGQVPKPIATMSTGAPGSLGKAYTINWQNVNVGDVIEFAPGDLWQVITYQQYPGYKPSTSSGTSTGSGSGTTGGTSTSGTTVGAGTSGSTTASGTGTSSSSSTGTSNTSNTTQNYLQNWYNKQRYAILTLPNSQVVTVLPVIP